jgi:hypothetical protein
MMRIALLTAVLTSTGCTFVPLLDDYGQCERRCRGAHGVETSGARLGPLADTCRCWRGDDELGALPRRFEPDADDPRGRVCATDGVTYTEDEASEAEVWPLHQGACGACSNARDLALYRRTRRTLADQATRCALRYLLKGRAAAMACTRAIGFSAGCAECWVDNMACTISHCRAVCLHSRLRREPNSQGGALNACLACDEAHCGAPFIRCAGANRRRAGIPSDIERPEEEVWGSASGYSATTME